MKDSYQNPTKVQRVTQLLYVQTVSKEHSKYKLDFFGNTGGQMGQGWH
jgi:hypothetical protein